MHLMFESITHAMHDLWWIALLILCIGAALATLFGIAMESLKPEPPKPPYRMEFDEFYVHDENCIDK